MIEFKVFLGFCFRTDRQTNGRTDICNCRVAFVIENFMAASLMVMDS